MENARPSTYAKPDEGRIRVLTPAPITHLPCGANFKGLEVWLRLVYLWRYARDSPVKPIEAAIPHREEPAG